MKKSVAAFLIKIVDIPAKLRSRMRYFLYKNIYDVSSGFKFKGFEIFLFGKGEIILCKRSYIGTSSTINSVNGCRVTVCENVKISHNVRIYTSTDIADQDFSSKKLKKKVSDVYVGRDSWFGANVYIGPGVRVGENSVVGANSVVVKDVPDGEIWGGVPARFIKKKNA